MRHLNVTVSTLFVVLASILLSGCGADDEDTPSSQTSGNALNAAAQNTGGPGSTPSLSSLSSPPSASLNVFGASASVAASTDTGSDTVFQNMQASLSADSRQVAPVMHYAPGDSSSN